MMDILHAVQADLHKDWDTDLLEEYIAAGKKLIDDVAGVAQDYETPGAARSLLLAYVRYADSHATEVFKINYERDLLDLHIAAQVKAMTDEEESTNENQDSN